MSGARSLARAWSLARSDSTAETVAAVVIVLIVAGPALVQGFRYLRETRKSSGGSKE